MRVKKIIPLLILLVFLGNFIVTNTSYAFPDIEFGDAGGSVGLQILEQERKKEIKAQKKRYVENTVPEGCKHPTGKYGECPQDYFKLDFVPKGAGDTADLSWFEQGEQLLNNAITTVFNAIWKIYGEFLTLAITFLQWTVDFPFIDLFIGPMKGIATAFHKWVWLPLFGMVFVISMLAVTIYWKQGRKHLIGKSLFSIALISSIGMAIYGSLPESMSEFDKGFDGLGQYTVYGMLQVTPKSGTTEVANPDAPANDITPEQASNSKSEVKQKIADSIWKTMYYDVYLTLQWGDVTTGQKYIGGLFTHGGPSVSLRREWLIAKDDEGAWKGEKLTQYIDPKTGRAKVKGFELMTSDGIQNRLGQLFYIIVAGSPQILFLILAGLYIIWWSAIAVARYIWGQFRVVLAIYPEYGWREFFDWLWSVITAISMKFFLLVLVGIVLVFWSFVAQIPAAKFGTSNWMLVWIGRTLINLVVLLAMYVEWRNLKNRLVIPMPGGGQLTSIGTVPGSEMVERTVDKTTGFLGKTLRNIGRFGAAMLGYPSALPYGPWKTFAEWRQARKNRNQAIEEMQKRGYDPNNPISRQAFIEDMAKEGKWEQAQQMVSSLGDIDPDQNSVSVKVPKIKANLSNKARTLYMHMLQNNYHPLNKKHRQLWLERHPGDRSAMEEIEKYAEMPGYRRMIDPPAKDWSTVPPERPKFHTPEYDLWKTMGYEKQHQRFNATFKEMEQERRQQREKLMQEYRSLPIYKRVFRKVPHIPSPTTEEVLQRLREMDRQRKFSS